MIWEVDQLQAHARQGSARWQLDLAKLEEGTQVQVDEEALGDVRLLQVRLPQRLMGAPEEHYVRGPDLVASYIPPGQTALRTELYWRTLAPQPPVIAGLELIISQQTDLLDDNPAMETGFVARAESVWQLEGPVVPTGQPAQQATHLPQGLLLLRLVDPRWSCAVMVQPTDDCGVLLRADGQIVSGAFPLFQERLEKGVIRRGRLRSLILPRMDDLQVLKGCYETFLQTPPPLTR